MFLKIGSTENGNVISQKSLEQSGNGGTFVTHFRLEKF